MRTVSGGTAGRHEPSPFGDLGEHNHDLRWLGALLVMASAASVVSGLWWVLGMAMG